MKWRLALGSLFVVFVGCRNVPTTATNTIRLLPDALISSTQTWTLLGAASLLDAVGDDIDSADGSCTSAKYAYLDPLVSVEVVLGLSEIPYVPAGARITKVESNVRIKSDSFAALARYFAVTADNYVPLVAQVLNISPDGTCRVYTDTDVVGTDFLAPLYLSGFTNPTLTLSLVLQSEPQVGRINWYGTRVDVTYEYQTYEVDSRVQKAASPTSPAVE